MSGKTVRFVADESCDYAVVRALREQGHDVVAVAEIAPRSDDRDVMEYANREGRLLLTEDKDFGWLVYVSQLDSPGVILIRYPATARTGLAHAIIDQVNAKGPRLARAFVVAEPGSLRIKYRLES